MSGSRPTLHLAARVGDHQVVKILCEAGASVDCALGGGGTPLHTAAVEGHIEAARALISAGAGVNTADSHGSTSLLHAVSSAQVEIVKLLLGAGAEVDAEDERGNWPLLFAVMNPDNEQGEMVTTLLAAGACVSKVDSKHDGCAPLHFAAMTGNVAHVTALCEKGADVNVLEVHGQTPVFTAMIKNHEKVVRTLIEAGADITKPRSTDGCTLLHGAALLGHLASLRVLISAGAELNTEEHDGRTPLYLATKAGHIKVIQALRNAGACVNKSDNHSTTPAQYSQQREATTSMRTENVMEEEGKIKKCGHCGMTKNEGAKLKHCTGCHKALFCNQMCQKAGWKDHKVWCQK